MYRKIRRTLVLTAAALVATASLSACGLEPASQAVPDVKAGEKLAEYDSLGNAPIVTSSKDFTEQLILGKILSLVLKAKGADVSDQTNAKGSANAREAMVSGAADVMWEYTGTGWVTYLGHTPDLKTGKADGVEIGDAKQVYDAVKKEDLEKNGIFWGTPAPFNNTYALAVTKADAKKYNLKKMSDIAKMPKDKQTFCFENEFENRVDGWLGVKARYPDIETSNVDIMDAGIVYSEIGKACVIGEVFDTDGRIPGLDLQTLEDDQKAFPIYNPSVAIREEINKAHPQIAEMFNAIGQELSTDIMRELNARVDVDGEDPAAVAKDWLTENKYLKPDDTVVG